MNTERRSYRMTVRARSVQQTRRRILDATIALHEERLAHDISLDHVADRAGVSVQTVLRHFGSRADLVEAAFDQVESDVTEERSVDPGDVDGAVRVVVDHYELRGDGVLLLLAQESTHDVAARVTRAGRRIHRRWVADAFAPFTAAADDPGQLVDLLVVATDVYTWKLLRRDRGLSRDQSEHRIRTVVGSLLATLTPERS